MSRLISIFAKDLNPTIAPTVHLITIKNTSETIIDWRNCGGSAVGYGSAGYGTDFGCGDNIASGTEGYLQSAGDKLGGGGLAPR